MVERNRFLRSIRYPALFVLLLWVIKGFELWTHRDLVMLGNYPREASGMIGIIFSPLIHARDLEHLWYNSIPLLLLSTMIIYFYPSAARKVIIIIYLFSGVAVWLFARHVPHIGASGLVYGFAFFLFFSGVFRNDLRSLAISFFIIFMYGGIVWNLLPTHQGISWESHLFGAIAGSFCAYLFRFIDLPPKPEWLLEEEKQPEVTYRYIYIPKDKSAELPAPEENNPNPDEKNGADQNP